MSTAPTTTSLKGGEWLIKESSPHETFIPEDFTEEQKMIRDMCDQFLRSEVMPVVERLDGHEEGLMRSLMEKAGEQGLLAASFPERDRSPSGSSQPDTSRLQL